MSAHQDVSGLTQRQLLVGALAGVTGMAIMGRSGLFHSQHRQRLFVNTTRGRLLFLGPQWDMIAQGLGTWRMVLTDSLTGDPDADLDGDGPTGAA